MRKSLRTRRIPALAAAVAVAVLPVSIALGRSDSEQRGAAADAAAWSVIHFQAFEGIFPPKGGLWTVHDINGTQVGGDVKWDDTSTASFEGSWSAHPTDGPPYSNLTETYMRYGPFSLAGATNADTSFVYKLDSESGYDFFYYGFSCNGGVVWQETAVSGATAAWKAVTVSLKKCVGKTNVLVQFRFVSEYAFTDQGVWVDNVRIRKYA